MIMVTIHPIIEHPEEVPRIAAWFFEEWRSLYGEETQMSVQRRIETWLTRKQIPTAFVQFGQCGDWHRGTEAERAIAVFLLALVGACSLCQSFAAEVLGQFLLRLLNARLLRSN